MNEQQIINWLLEGDISIQYQVWRDLLGHDNKELQNRISTEGWGKKFLSKRRSNGHWGDSFYQPKWASTHYTLLDLRTIGLAPDCDAVQDTIHLVLTNSLAEDGGIKLGPSTSTYSDVCVNAMFLNYASYFKTPEKNLHSVVDSILNEIMPDGGFNCRTKRNGALHSSLHTTISVLEGLTEFQRTGLSYKKEKIARAIKSSVEFILMHHLFLSDRTGEIIHKDFLKPVFPYRWKYDILRALDHFQFAKTKPDKRMNQAIHALKSKRNTTGTWNLYAPHPGKVHFVMEPAGKPSRWNTLRALRVLKYYSHL